jgi:DNA mismatch repair protein MutH
MRPPATLAELLDRADALVGRTVGELAVGRGVRVVGGRTQKGLAGALLEAVLGATAGGRAEPDFPALGVELKSIPIDATGKPLQSTFVCVMPLDATQLGPWSESWPRRKLRQVLWVPLVAAEDPADVLVGGITLWTPTDAQDAVLRADYDEVRALLAEGHLGRLDGHLGAALQVRPKGADDAASSWAQDTDGDWVRDIPRGFYLRPSFTRGVLAG